MAVFVDSCCCCCCCCWRFAISASWLIYEAAAAVCELIYRWYMKLGLLLLFRIRLFVSFVDLVRPVRCGWRNGARLNWDWFNCVWDCCKLCDPGWVGLNKAAAAANAAAAAYGLSSGLEVEGSIDGTNDEWDEFELWLVFGFVFDVLGGGIWVTTGGGMGRFSRPGGVLARLGIRRWWWLWWFSEVTGVW